MLKGKVVGEEYYPLGTTQFNSLINKIKLTKPDVIYADHRRRHQRRLLQAAQGGRHRPAEADAADDLGDRGRNAGIGGENIAGFYACMKYFQSLDNPNNKKFVTAFKAKYGDKT